MSAGLATPEASLLGVQRAGRVPTASPLYPALRPDLLLGARQTVD